MGAHEKIIELPGAAGAQPSIFQDPNIDRLITLEVHQQAQARLSTGAEGLESTSTEAKRLSAFTGSRVGVLPEVLAGLTGQPAKRPSEDGAP